MALTYIELDGSKAGLPSFSPDKAIVSDSSGQLTPSTITSTELSYLSGATSNIQNQIDSISPVGGFKRSTMLDVGALPDAQLSVVIPDSDIHSTSSVVGWYDYQGTGKDFDEMEMDQINLSYYITEGNLHITVVGLVGYIHDKFNFNYYIIP